MKKFLKRIVTVALAATMLFSVVACGENNDGPTTTKKYDAETRPVRFAISALDGVFNPFFYTSASDGNVIGLTQISMLSTDNDGNVVCGEDEPTVVLDYSIKSYDVNGNEAGGDAAEYTEYKFVIKNGIKFSDGVDLTIDDVLFNLYVYLDPMYSGSSTVYSVDIQGLNAYRYNDATLSDNANVSSSQFRLDAVQRVNNVIKWADDEMEETTQIKEDVAKIREQFKKDLNSDWTSNFGQLESYSDYSFTEDWQSYYLLEGLISIEYDKKGNIYTAKKDENGKYITSLTGTNKDYVTTMADATAPEKLQAYMAEHNCTEETAKNEIQKSIAIETVYNSYASDASLKAGVKTILQGMTTGSTIIDIWTLEEQSKYYDKIDTSKSVKSVSGITTEKVTSFKGVNNVDLKGESHDVLCIKINGIDPKAIWNFAFPVAPMHYYSDAATIADKENYPYGVKARNKQFFDEVLNEAAKSKVPVGAGTYRASTEKGTTSNDPYAVKGADFWANSEVYYERNEYFYTVGKGLSNAKIKYFIYSEVGDSNILNRLIAQEIDYGMPNAKPANLTEVSKYDYLGSRDYMTNGYGYVGINPKYVPDIEVRRAIMKAFDKQHIFDYYDTMASEITRPMSKLSWAYPTDAEDYYGAATNEEIMSLVESAGWKKNKAGIYEKDGKQLELKFTIAGDTTDHPAYKMFENARQTLNDCGFKITVGTDVSALKKLANGGLAVWAAAWTSTVDPDMYQIYHKDSQTTNRKNWNYDEILNNPTEWEEEVKIINALSDLIDAGRATNNQDDRAEIYSQALDKVMELAVEYPTYQRKDLSVYNKEVIKASTLNQEQNLKYSSLTERIWEIDYN